MPRAAAGATQRAASAPAERVRAIRRWWRVVEPPPSVFKRLEPLYYAAITAVLVVPFVYGTASSALADVLTPRAVAAWGASLLLVAVLALVRWGAVQGPVVFSTADVAQLLGAPLPRAQLVTGRLIRGLAWGAGGAALGAGAALIGIAGHGRGVAVERAAGFVIAAMLLGVLGMSGAALVQGSARWDRVTRRANWPILAAAVGLVFVSSSGATGRTLVLWSGPWGWAVQPLCAGTGWPVACGLLLVVTATLVVVAFRRRGDCSTERHMLRAEARDGAVAAMYSLNARYVGRSLTSVNAGPDAGRGSWIRRPGAAYLAIVWRDAVAAVGRPQRLAEAVALAVAGTLVCLLNADHPAAVAGGALATYAGAARLLEPLRAETDAPGRARVLLRAPLGRTLMEHAILPALVVLSAALVAAAGCAVAGALPRHGAAAALLAVGATPAITLCAALSSRRGGQLPASLMSTVYADTTGMGGAIVVAWIAAWPVLAVALGTVPPAIVVQRGVAPLPQLVALLVAVPVGLTAALGWERFAP